MRWRRLWPRISFSTPKTMRTTPWGGLPHRHIHARRFSWAQSSCLHKSFKSLSSFSKKVCAEPVCGAQCAVDSRQGLFVRNWLVSRENPGKFWQSCLRSVVGRNMSPLIYGCERKTIRWTCNVTQVMCASAYLIYICTFEMLSSQQFSSVLNMAWALNYSLHCFFGID